MSLNHKAKTPPIADKGIAVKINKDCFMDLNVKNNKMKISKSAMGTAIDNRAVASTRFSNCPPYVI
jgi:hypothetical protein